MHTKPSFFIADITLVAFVNLILLYKTYILTSHITSFMKFYDHSIISFDTHIKKHVSTYKHAWCLCFTFRGWLGGGIVCLLGCTFPLKTACVYFTCCLKISKVVGFALGRDDCRWNVNSTRRVTRCHFHLRGLIPKWLGQTDLRPFSTTWFQNGHRREAFWRVLCEQQMTHLCLSLTETFLQLSFTLSEIHWSKIMPIEGRRSIY